MFHKWFKAIKQEVILPNFFEANITLTPKPEKDTTENYKPTPVMNVDAKILNKNPANQI